MPHRRNFLGKLFESPSGLLGRLVGSRPQKRSWIDPRLEQQKIAAVADLLTASGNERISRKVESLLVFDSIIIVELGQRKVDDYLQVISVQYLSRFDAYRIDWRERVEERTVRLGLADFETAEQVVSFVERCVTAYLDQTEVPDASELPPMPVPPMMPPQRPRRS